MTAPMVASTTTIIEPGKKRPIFFGQNQMASVQIKASASVGQFKLK